MLKPCTSQACRSHAGTRKITGCDGGCTVGTGAGFFAEAEEGFFPAKGRVRRVPCVRPTEASSRSTLLRAASKEMADGGMEDCFEGLTTNYCSGRMGGRRENGSMQKARLRGPCIRGILAGCADGKKLREVKQLG